jgi:hypothetical protein
MFRKAVRSTLLPLLAALGCSSTPSGVVDLSAGTDPLGAVPADFSLDLTVQVGAGTGGAGPDTAGAGPDAAGAGPGAGGAGPDTGEAGPVGTEVSRRPARYVVFCDGSLHWEAGGADPARGLPPKRRLLDQRQIAGLWSLLERLGYTDPDNATAPVNATLVEAAPGETVSLGIITGHGRRWAVLSRDGPGRKPDPAMPRLIALMDGLAWATAADEPTAGAPRRPVYGPDPYARYRRP